MSIFAAAAAAAAGLSNSTTGTPTGFPNAAGASPYVITPQDQQYLAALTSAGQLLPGKAKNPRVFLQTLDRLEHMADILQVFDVNPKFECVISHK